MKWPWRKVEHAPKPVQPKRKEMVRHARLTVFFRDGDTSSWTTSEPCDNALSCYRFQQFIKWLTSRAGSEHFLFETMQDAKLIFRNQVVGVKFDYELREKEEA